jgi:surface protein
MKQKLLYFKLIFLLFYNIQAFSQNVLLKNKVGIEGSKSINIYDLQIDSQNNRYVSGTFSGTADFDSSPNEALLTTNGGNDIFLAKYDQNGNYLWAFNIGGTSTSGFYYDSVGSIILDNNGNIYLTGDITGDTDVDPSANTSILSAGIFLAKYNSNGGYLWSFSIYGSSLSQGGRSLAVDNSNNIYMAGVFANSNADFDPSSNESILQAVGSTDYFVTKYTEDGNYLWAFNLGDVNQVSGDINIVTDYSENLYVSGNFRDTMDFDPSNLVGSHNSRGNMFLAKYNSSGTYLWAKNIETIHDVNGGVSNVAYGMDIDLDNNIYLSGIMELPVDFDPSESIAIVDMPSNTKQSFLCKYDEDGNYKWAKAFANSNDSLSTDLVVDSQNNNIYVTGYSNYPADFDPTNKEDIKTSNASYQNLYLTKYDSAGGYKWAVTVGADEVNDKSYANSIVINNDDSQISLAGHFNGSIDFNSLGQQNILENTNNYSNGFIATYNFTEPSTISIPDTNFEQALIDLGYDKNGLDGGMSQSDAEAIVSLNISNPTGNSNLPNVLNKIIDITGIETFVNLKSFYCSQNDIKDIDLSKNSNLTVFDARENDLESLNIANGNNENFTYFKIENNISLICVQVDNQQYSLDNWIFIDEQTGFSEDCSQNDAVSNYYTTIPDIDFENVLITNKIDTIQDGKFRTKDAYYISDLSTNWNDLKPISIKGIEAFKNLKKFSSSSFKLEKADLSKNLKLEEIYIQGTKIDSLDASNLLNLQKLYVDENELVYLNTTGLLDLEILNCTDNNLTKINLNTNTKLKLLLVMRNNLKEIDVTKNINLDTFGCYDNNLIELDVSNSPKLFSLNCSNNELEYLNIKKGNTSWSDLYTKNNPNLRCIEVDNVAYYQQYFTSAVDDINYFKDFCTPLSEKSFITKWETSNNNEKITINLASGSHNFNVNWGDGSDIESGFTDSASHIYLKFGTYIVTITGTLENLQLSTNQIIEIKQWGTNKWKNLSQAFVYCGNVQLTATDTPNLSLVNNLSYMFNSCQKLNADISNWDVSTITDMTSMFAGAASFNQSLANWDVTNVTNMTSMLRETGMSVINYDKTLISWSEKNLQNDVSLWADTLNYCTSETARNKIINDFNWTISDAGKDCSTIDSPVNINGMWNDPTNWASGVVPTTTDNVVIPTGATLQISDDISEINSLENDGTIIINPTYSLKSKSNMVNYGTIVMNSDNDDSSVLFVVGTSTGDVKYSRGGLKANLWSLVTPPVSGQNIKEFALNTDNDIRVNAAVNPGRYAIGYYDDTKEAGQKWSYYTEDLDAGLTFTAGESYALSRNTDGSVSFTGTLTTNNNVKTLKPGEWNAIGNPFTTYYPANKNGASSFINDNYDILDDEFKGLYIWDSAQNKYVVVSELDIQNRSLTPGQGFFIKVKAGENTIEFKETKRSLKPTIGDNIFSKEEFKYIKLIATNNSHTVTTDIKFLSNATKGFDIGLDIGNFSASSFDLYTHLVDESNTNNYTIQSLPLEDKEEVIIPISILSNKSEVYLSTLHENLPENLILLLEDRENDVFTDITNKESNYKLSFSDFQNTQKTLYLHISFSKSLSANDSSIDKIQIYSANKTLYVKGLKGRAAIEVYNVLGQRVFILNSTKDQEINVPMTLTEGVYTVKLSSENRKVTKKIVIN